MQEIPWKNQFKVTFDETDSDLKFHSIIDLFLYENQDLRLNIGLRPLWFEDSNFLEGDYYVHTIYAFEIRKGYGTIIHDFLSCNYKLLPLKTKLSRLFSTNINEGHFSKNAKPFWDAQLKREKAIFHDELNRYELILL